MASEQQGPWTKYAAPVEHGPWEKYATPSTTAQPPAKKQSPMEMLGEGEELGAKGMETEAPLGLETGAAIAGGEVAPVVGALGYLATKGLMEPKEVKEHPYRTAAETATIGFLPGVLGKISETAAPYISKAGSVLKDLLAPAEETGGALGKVAPEATKVPTLNDIVGNKPNQPIYPRPAGGTVGAKTVTEAPNPEAPLKESNVETPSRNQTLTQRTAPLEPKTPLKDQPAAFEKPAGKAVDESVHPMDRQIIRANGSKMFEMTEGKPELREDLHGLRNQQLSEVLRKSGEDMGTKTVETPGKTSDPSNYSRPEAFEILFEKGYTPERILKEAPKAGDIGLKPTQPRKPFGPAR